MTRLQFTRNRIRIAVIGGATLLAAGAIGTTAALATSAGNARDETNVASVDGRRLVLETAAPPPLAMPDPSTADGQLAVLADIPADLAVDPSLGSGRDLALIREADAAQAHDARVQAALWAGEEARMQAQIDAAMRPSTTPMDSDAGDPAVPPASAHAGDPEITASAGDTRRQRPSED